MRGRQQRLAVLEALERRARDFRTREALWPLKVPREPLVLEEIIEGALPDDAGRFAPLALRSRTLLHLEWPDTSQWELWLTVLPSKLKLLCDTGGDESRVLASGGRHAGDEAVRLFLERLAESAGQDFGIELAGGAPSRVRSAIADRAFLVDVFVTLFEVSGTEASVREHLGPHAGSASDFRHDVEEWFDRAIVR